MRFYPSQFTDGLSEGMFAKEFDDIRELVVMVMSYYAPMLKGKQGESYLFSQNVWQIV